MTETPNPMNRPDTPPESPDAASGDTDASEGTRSRLTTTHKLADCPACGVTINARLQVELEIKLPRTDGTGLMPVTGNGKILGALVDKHDCTEKVTRGTAKATTRSPR